MGDVQILRTLLIGDLEFENQEILRLEEFVTGRVIDEI